MLSFEGYKPIDLSPRIKARVHRVDGSLKEGTPDPYGRPWVMQEGRYPGDNSLFTLYSAPPGDAAWHQERMTSHHGSHVQGGKGHISHWPGMPKGMKGLWELPLATFIGEAAVCNLASLAPAPIEDPADYPHGKGWSLQSKPGDVRGQRIEPEHLAKVQKGDIVLLTSPYQGLEQPWLPPATVEWLVKDRKIKLLGLGAPGIEWQYNLKAQPPANSPVRRLLLGANIPIAHPLVNIDTIKADRVFYFGLPLRMKRFEASFTRALALEPPAANHSPRRGGVRQRAALAVGGQRNGTNPNPLTNKRVVDLTVELVSRLTRLNGTVEEGTRDVYGMPWIVEETVNERDGTIEHLVGANRGTIADWPIGGLSGHMGSHIQLGVGHNDNWTQLPKGMRGIWDMPLPTYFGEATVCKLDALKRQPILPEHLAKVREGDILLLTSKWSGKDQPWLPGNTAYWLAEQKRIKMLGVAIPGITWETNHKAPEPGNSPTHRAMTGNNIPIVYPLANIGQLRQERVFFLSLPLNVERMEGTWVRAIAIENNG